MSADISQPNTSPFTYSFAFILSMFTRQIEGEDGAAGGCSGDNLHGGLNKWGLGIHDEKDVSVSEFDGEKFRTERMNISPDLRRLWWSPAAPRARPLVSLYTVTMTTPPSVLICSVCHTSTQYTFFSSLELS